MQVYSSPFCPLCLRGVEKGRASKPPSQSTFILVAARFRAFFGLSMREYSTPLPDTNKKRSDKGKRSEHSSLG